MTELQVLSMALGAWVGALLGFPLATAPLAILAVVAVGARRPWLVVAAVTALAGGLGASAERAYRVAEPHRYDGNVRLVTDPEPNGFGWRADVALADGRRMRLTASGPAAIELSRSTAGLIATVSGRVRPIDPEPWVRARHLVGRLSVDRVDVQPGSLGWHRWPSEVFRRLVANGASRLPDSSRPLYLGLVIGDDRAQTAAQQARFRATGLTHLLAVSGQNVAFVLAAVGPLVRRAGRNAGLMLTIGVLLVFAIATRLEPSVVRATVMAGLAAVAATTGRRATGLRVLGLAVTALVLIDPFLVHSVGFQLSVAASAGILLLGPPLEARLPGPTFVVQPSAITIGAQAAALPLLLLHFGPVSPVSLPANILVGWAAGAVMSWGLTLGLVAGAIPDPIGSWLQIPAHLLVWWIDQVSRWGAAVPVPAVSVPLAVALLGAGVVLWAAPRRAGVGLASAGVLAVAALTVAPGPHDAMVLAGQATLVPAGSDHPSVLVVEAGLRRDRLLDELVATRVRSVDLVVARSGSRTTAQLIGEIRDLVAVTVVLAPPQHRIPGARRLDERVVISTAIGPLVIEPDSDRLVVSQG